MAHTPIATFTKGSTMFWVGHDGDYITVISKDEHFSTINSLQKIMPDKVELVMDEEEQGFLFTLNSQKV